MDPADSDDGQLQTTPSESGDPSFSSAPAREEFRRARRLKLVRNTAFVLIVMAGWACVILRVGSGSSSSLPLHSGSLNTPPVGSPDAKVKVRCIIPGTANCHQSLTQFLIRIARAAPGRFYIEFEDMDAYAEDELKSTIGVYCAAIVVNGETSFDFVLNGNHRVIKLIGTVPTHYTFEQVGEVMTYAYTEQYGPPEAPLYKLPPAKSGHDQERSHSAEVGRGDKDVAADAEGQAAKARERKDRPAGTAPPVPLP